MCYAFLSQDVLKGYYLGSAKQARGPVAETVRGYAPDTFQYTTDLDRARALFDEAGVREGTELTLMQTVGDSAVAELYQASLQEIGITLKIEVVDQTTFTAVFYGDDPAEERPNVMPWSWWPDYNDAYNHLYPIVACASWGANGGNGGVYCNERVDELLEQAKNAADAAVYEQALAEAQSILSETDPAAVYFAQPAWTTVLRGDVQGFVFNPINLGTYDFHKLSRAQ
jgi:peptide/nickel transport system substrate-binding protein